MFIPGWVTSFLIDYRDGNSAQIGYVTVGFWVGIILGRFLLVQAATKIGGRNVVYMFIIDVGVFQLLV